MSSPKQIAAAGLLTVALLAIPVQADLYGFVNITGNSATDAAIGEAQMFVEVTGFGASQVLFTFTNVGPDPSSITDVYFDDGALIALDGLTDKDDDATGAFGDAGVDFSPLASPGDLPGGNAISPPFQTTAGFSADSDPSASSNGVNPGETLGVLFDLVGGKDLGDVISDLDSGALRIGIHVQAFEDGDSESFINIPAPSAVVLGMLGLSAVGLIRKRRPA